MSILGGVLRQISAHLRPDPQQFLGHVSGVVHVGANTGQERLVYEQHGLNVLWIEPIPSIYETLLANIKPFPRQRACQALITDRHDTEQQFHISNNDGRSSSILELKHHADIWPTVNYSASITLRSTTLTALFEKEAINPADYGALIMDTQGSELMVLQGSIPLLKGFEYIKTEVSDFESYAGCCQLADIQAFMKRHGYAEVWRQKFADRPQGGGYYDVTYRKKALRRMFRR